jgi:hypothetical protein
MLKIGPRIDNDKGDVEATVKPWIEKLARLGFTAKGVVYSTIGILAARLAFGYGGDTTDAKGALRTIAEATFGKTLLALVAIGLVCYAIWRFVEAVADPEQRGTGVSGIVHRVGFVFVGVFYSALAISAVHLIRGQDGGPADFSEAGWTARIMAQPFGRWLVGLVGAGVIIFFVYQSVQALRGKFPQQLQGGDLGPETSDWARRLGTVGLLARAVVFGLVGLFLIRAAVRYEPEQAGGLDQSLEFVAVQPYGKVLLGIVALGLVGYGSYMLLIAWFRRNFFLGSSNSHSARE